MDSLIPGPKLLPGEIDAGADVPTVSHDKKVLGASIACTGAEVTSVDSAVFSTPKLAVGAVTNSVAASAVELSIVTLFLNISNVSFDSRCGCAE